MLNTCLAQDFHFSQFDANPFYVNPALTGERLNADYKGIQVNADYRDQMSRYSKFPSSYKSIAAGIDEPVSSKLALGQFFYNDRSATGTFNTTGFVFSVAHKIIDQNADNQGNHNLSVGLQMGLVNKSINPEKFTYDEQYSSTSDDGFDRSIPSGELFVRQSYYNFNVNFGIYYRATSKNKKYSAFGGFSIYNIGQPNESFLDGGNYSALPLRFNLHGGAVCKLTKQLSMLPQFLYMNQAKATELYANVLMFYKIENSNYETIYGLGVRNKDAIVFQLGIRTKGITVRLSYDVITNYTKAYRNKGLEASLAYTFKKRVRPAKNPPADTPASEAGKAEDHPPVQPQH